MLQLCNCTTLSCIIAIVYLAFTGFKMYQMVNPLSGIEISGPTIDPQWQRNQTFSMLCFLSASKRFSQFKISELKAKKSLLFVRHGLRFDEAQAEITMHFNITDGREEVKVESGKGKGKKSKKDTVEIIHSAVSNKIWRLLRTNSSAVHLHVLVLKDVEEGLKSGKGKKESDLESLINESNEQCINSACLDTNRLPYDEISLSLLRSGIALYDIINMVKFDKVPKYFRQRYLLSDLGLVTPTPEEVERSKVPLDAIISFWKPEVAVRLVTDFTAFPVNYVPEAISQNTISVPRTPGSQSQQLQYKPPIHADEIGLTSSKYVALNQTVSFLPLQISYAPLSLQRWLFMQNMEESLKQQSGVGFGEKDIDDVRRLISDTSIYLLTATMVASMLHLLFEFLAFQSDISFWKQNKSLAGLSVRSVVCELFSQIIVFLFLLDSDTSLLVTGPTFFGILVQMWKVQKATGIRLVRNQGSIVPYKIEYSRLEEAEEEDEKENKNKEEKVELLKDSSKVDDVVIPDSDGNASKSVVKSESKAPAISIKVLTQVTLEADRVATYYLSAMLFPLAVAFAMNSLINERHETWYSWGIGALTGCVYTFGFVLMCPQLFINHKLKSVSHLPWKFLIFRFLNTFIDDLFAFVIKMPTMHRLSVFRDDIVFLIYMYQRYIYRVDDSRPIEK